MCVKWYAHTHTLGDEMKPRLFAKTDCLLVRNESVRGLWIPPSEAAEVIALVGEVSYALYTFYRTAPFKEAEDFSDSNLGNLIGWSERKVQRYRKILEANDLYLTVRYGTKADGVTKMFVGTEILALFNAGLPSNILNVKALNKIKTKLNIRDSISLISRVQEVVSEYESNPEQYKQ
jgi:hypothetical protein